MDKMKQKFEECLKKNISKSNSFLMDNVKYKKLIEDVKLGKTAGNKENRHYYLLRHYDVITVGGKEQLVVPVVNDQILYYVTSEELFDILYKTHESIGHGGRDRMRNELKQRYKNITLNEIQTFLNLCEPCIQKRKCPKKGSVDNQIGFSQLNSRCQVDLIDYQSQADGEYKFIMVYQDHLTKFTVLRALRSKTEVAQQVLDIFLLFGAPSILQSDNGREFCNSIIESLKIMWPELKIVHGSLSQGSVERPNQDVEAMLTTWMLENSCNSWSKGLPFVQFMKNRALHADIKKSPYEAMFRQPVKVGLTSSALRMDTIKKINTEEELENILEKVKVMQQKEEVNVIHQEETLQSEDVLEIYIDNKEGILDLNISESKQNYTCDICTKVLESNEKEICDICSQRNKIKIEKDEAKEDLEFQIKRMKHISDASHPDGYREDSKD